MHAGRYPSGCLHDSRSARECLPNRCLPPGSQAHKVAGKRTTEERRGTAARNRKFASGATSRGTPPATGMGSRVEEDIGVYW
jgi:hypothetical protein